MTEPMADIPQEGADPFANVEPESENSEATPAEESETDKPKTPDGEEEIIQEDPDKDKPFHKHPRWKKREKEWEDRFNSQESRHQDDIKTLRDEFKDARKDNKEQTEIPSWFGGDQKQWDDYRSDRDAEIKAAEDRAIKSFSKSKDADNKLVEEATAYMKSEIDSIQDDTELNPTGKKIDTNKLLKIVMDNDLVDSKGRWNYKAGFRIMNASKKKSASNNKDRKVIGDISNNKPGTESKPAPFKTSADFKKDRPW